MNKNNRLLLAFFINIVLSTCIYGQDAGSSIKKNFIFSAIAGTNSKPDSIKLPSEVRLAKITKGDSSSFKIHIYNKGLAVLQFSPIAGFTGIARAELQLLNTSGKIIYVASLTGLSTPGLEGRNEPPLSGIVDALGYQISIGWKELDNHCLPELQGEELASSLFKKAGKGKVEILPLARYSPDFEVPFGYYLNTNKGPQLYQAGVLAKRTNYPEHQILFPAIASGTGSFDPGDKQFGFYATGPTHSGYSEDSWNMLLHPSHAVHATRIYPVKDKEGRLLKHTYLICFEEAKNGDYNDYVFLVKNIVPVKDDYFTALFNGKNLEGWDIFLRNIGNTDPNNNFRIVNGELFVSGKDLGYVITKKGYKNFHLKVDFKWGEKRWPPRGEAKRDAGICYNIPINEPDSIWPQSIECQIQEGDVGDFWLLGFSTIKVNGIKNVPANHTRMIKQKDAEKPSGTWNTVEVISYNGKCVHIVNGVVVNVGEEASVKEGKILLQSEYAEIYYRNIKIRGL